MPPRHLAESTRLRFSYACIMACHSRLAARAFARMLRANLGHSPGDDLWFAYSAWCLGRLELSRTINRRIACEHPQSPEASIALREAEFARQIETGDLRRTLGAALDRALPSMPQPATLEEPLIVVPISGRYLELFTLWHRQLQRHAAGTLLVFAMDLPAVEALGASGIAHVDLSPWFGFDAAGRIEDYSKRHLWVLRVFLLRELAARNHHVLSLDLDAILVGDLGPLIKSLPAADIVVQQDYSIPVDVARKLGFIVCCGFLAIRPSHATMTFLDRYASATAQELDDQTAINHLLARAGLRNRRGHPNATSFRSLGLAWVMPSREDVSRDIAHGKIVRHFQQTMPLTIAEISSRLGPER